MDDFKLERLKRFASDQHMFEAVFEEIQKSFVKRRQGADVHVLAATTLSLYQLEDARKDLITYSTSGEEENLKKIQHV
jgi:hypothetical protein